MVRPSVVSMTIGIHQCIQEHLIICETDNRDSYEKSVGSGFAWADADHPQLAYREGESKTYKYLIG